MLAFPLRPHNSVGKKFDKNPKPTASISRDLPMHVRSAITKDPAFSALAPSLSSAAPKAAPKTASHLPSYSKADLLKYTSLPEYSESANGVQGGKVKFSVPLSVAREKKLEHSEQDPAQLKESLKLKDAAAEKALLDKKRLKYAAQVKAFQKKRGIKSAILKAAHQENLKRAAIAKASQRKKAASSLSTTPKVNPALARFLNFVLGKAEEKFWQEEVDGKLEFTMLLVVYKMDYEQAKAACPSFQKYLAKKTAEAMPCFHYA